MYWFLGALGIYLLGVFWFILWDCFVGFEKEEDDVPLELDNNELIGWSLLWFFLFLLFIFYT